MATPALPADIVDQIEIGDDDISDSEYASSYRSETTSLTSSVFHFVYENGRRYTSDRKGAGSGYVLPNDAEEQVISSPAVDRDEMANTDEAIIIGTIRSRPSHLDAFSQRRAPPRTSSQSLFHGKVFHPRPRHRHRHLGHRHGRCLSQL
jgi:hypothetical protein